MNFTHYPLIEQLPTLLLTFVLELSEETGYAHALQRSDVKPAGRNPRDRSGRGSGGRGRGRGGRGTPYVKVFVDPFFVPPAGTKYCWFHG